MTVAAITIDTNVDCDCDRSSHILKDGCLHNPKSHNSGTVVITIIISLSVRTIEHVAINYEMLTTYQAPHSHSCRHSCTSLNRNVLMSPNHWHFHTYRKILMLTNHGCLMCTILFQHLPTALEPEP